jgi:hypothetical protein
MKLSIGVLNKKVSSFVRIGGVNDTLFKGVDEFVTVISVFRDGFG